MGEALHVHAQALPPPDVDGPGMTEKRYLLFAALLICAGCALIHLHPAGDTDTFWHLTLGRAVLAHRARTFPEPVAFEAFTDLCTAPEWLWEVAATLIVGAGGFAALCVALMLVAAGSAGALFFLLRRAVPQAAAAPLILTALLVLLVTQCALVLRPHSSYHLLLPLFLGALYAMAEAPAPARWRWLVLLVALQLLWVQLHGSFILGPPLFVLFAFFLARRDASAEARRPLLLAVLGLCLTLLTGAYGAGFLSFLISHSGGDAVRHIQDMAAPTWADLQPQTPYQVGFWLLVVLNLCALVRCRPPLREVALSLFGLALLATAVRFFDAAAILLSPLALRGACSLWPGALSLRLAAPLSLAVAIASLSWLASATATWWGPRGHLGLWEANLPLGAVAFIRALPPGQRVLSSYEASSPLGYFLQGHARTYVDGRTPLYFDSADYALSRTLLSQPGALGRGLRRYGITVAVAPRGAPVCALLSAIWDPVFSESGFTTFLPRPGQAQAQAQRLRHLQPCGDGYLGKDVCSDGGAEAIREIAAQRDRYPSPFYDLIEAQVRLRCGAPAAAVLPRLPAGPGQYEGLWRRVRAQVLLKAGDSATAIALLTPLVQQGDAEALNLLLPAMWKDMPVERIRALMDQVARAQDDRLIPPLSLALAKLCMAQEDAECARFHGLRAFASGAPGADEVLRWLVEHHPAPRVRGEAAGWLGIQREKQAQPERPVQPGGP
jgi:hypothetical protein